MPGCRWAAALESARDQVADACQDLDPASEGGQRRESDGRTIWLEPTAPHLTSTTVLAQEEHILTWAMGAEAEDPNPSTTINRAGLDVLQADAGAAVAGADWLVVVVGPAGTGKTTMVSRAVDDLHVQGRPVFGVAPTAKAARVLGAETGIAADTVAKLLHEWARTDRPPEPQYRLPGGATVIVDEAGTIGTASLHKLVGLAEDHDWRLALVGDPRQLQAVGRGGMFNGLCATSRAFELARIHRFHEPWEATASLQLRAGSPKALDAHEAHGRITGGPFDDHLTRIAEQWLEHTAARRSVAITAATNHHVDAINRTIQHERLAAGHLFRKVGPGVGAGEQRPRRRRRGHSSQRPQHPHHHRRAGPRPRSLDGHRHPPRRTHHGRPPRRTRHRDPSGRLRRRARAARLRRHRTRQPSRHGRCGRRTRLRCHHPPGLYVGMTRGRDTNQLLVITETADLSEAHGLIHGVLAHDRADIPTVTQRPELAQQLPPPTPQARPRTPQPRLAVPDWLGTWRTDSNTGERTSATRSPTGPTGKPKPQPTWRSCNRPSPQHVRRGGPTSNPSINSKANSARRCGPPCGRPTTKPDGQGSATATAPPAVPLKPAPARGSCSSAHRCRRG